MRMKEIITVKGIDCYEENGVAYLKLEAVARGLGFTQEKNGVEYVKWERVNGYLAELGFSPEVGKNGFIPENIFYRLAMKAKNETAERFQALIADEIIPEIRRHGAYLTDAATEAFFSDPDTFAKLAMKWRDERHARLAAEAEAREKQAKIEADAPKVLFADSVAASRSEILVGELAKMMKQNGLAIGQNRLFEILRRDGYLVSRRGTDWNMPTQRSMELGVMRIKETSVTHADGHVTVSRTPKITGKGQVYFINRYQGRMGVQK